MNELERDELEFKASEFGRLTPIEYGKLRDISGPQVYYYLKQGAPFEHCECGRRIVDVKLMDEWLTERRKKGTLREGLSEV